MLHMILLYSFFSWESFIFYIENAYVNILFISEEGYGYIDFTLLLVKIRNVCDFHCQTLNDILDCDDVGTMMSSS